jgi:hypothetical protein
MSLDEKVSVIRSCKLCDVVCSRTNDWNRHILTAKHAKNVKLDGLITAKVLAFRCDTCDYSCDKQSLWDKHINTNKHKIPQNLQTHECSKCKKTYDKYNSYWAHSKKCNVVSDNDKNIYSIVNKLLSENREFRNFIIEQSKSTNEIVNKALECCKPVSNTTTINGNVNNTQKFNINIFLNEQCKDAINFADFIKNIEVSHEDLENNAQLGFVGGISKIFIDNLKQLGVNERPIHCTDVKRETIYIKDEDKWTKETDDAKLQKAVQMVSQKSTRKLIEWKQENPDYQDADSKFSIRCLQMQKHAIAGSDRDVYYPKVIHALAREVILDK